MCGVIGKISYNNSGISEGLSAMRHRGPDAHAEIHFKVGHENFYLGHSRLSIIDLDQRSNQPFSVSDRYYLSFNGEIYNYKDLRKKLSEFQFKTNSDTEVLIYWLIKYGGDFLNELEGMFSFCFFDKKANEIILGRDQLGIKPLYYSLSQKEFIFSSDINSLKTISGSKIAIDEICIQDFLQLGYMIEPNTGFKNISKVPPGSFLKYNILKKELKQVEYWSPLTERDVKKNHEKLEILIEKSVKNQLVSDVPLGVFFSGGIDSSIIASKVPKSSKFLISVNDLNELKEAGINNDLFYAIKIAKILNIELTRLKADEEELDFLNNIEKVVYLNEELVSDYTSYPTYKLSKKAKEIGLSVMLSGMGADEIFAGYPRYLMMRYYNLFKRMAFIIPFIQKRPFFQKKIERFLEFINGRDPLESYLSLLTPFTQKNIFNLTGQNLENQELKHRYEKIWSRYEHLGYLKASMCFDVYGFLSHNFLLADKASMRASIEMRVPLATKELFGFGLNSKENHLINGKSLKNQLKKQLLNHLPKKIIYRRKAGFHPPLDKKISDLGKDRIEKHLIGSKLCQYLNIKEVLGILDEHFSGEKNNTFKIYRLLYLRNWLEVHDN